MNKIFTKKNMGSAIDTLLVIAGTFLMGFSFNVFLDANHISPSGFSGLSAIISNVLEAQFNVHISASIFYLAINAVLFIISFKTLGLKFAINSAIGIVAYSIFMEICKFDIGLADSHLLLYAIYGGVIMGLGLGLVIKGHGSTGGSDMLANLLNKKFRFITVGNFVFIVDFVVVALSFIAYNDLTLALYSLVAIYIMTKMTDIIVSGVNTLRAYYIISNKADEIAGRIITEVERGVTGFKTQGMYTHNEQNLIMTIVTKAESVKLRELVEQIDKTAFMYSSPVSEAMGLGFVPFKEKKQKRTKNKEERIDVDNKENELIKENKKQAKRTKNGKLAKVSENKDISIEEE